MREKIILNTKQARLISFAIIESIESYVEENLEEFEQFLLSEEGGEKM